MRPTPATLLPQTGPRHQAVCRSLSLPWKGMALLFLVWHRGKRWVGRRGCRAGVSPLSQECASRGQTLRASCRGLEEFGRWSNPSIITAALSYKTPSEMFCDNEIFEKEFDFRCLSGTHR